MLKKIFAVILVCAIALGACACAKPGDEDLSLSEKAVQGFERVTGIKGVRLPAGYRYISYVSYDDFVSAPNEGIGFMFEHDSYVGEDGLYSYASYIWNTCAMGVDSNGIFSVKESGGGVIKDTLFEGIEASYSSESGYTWYYYYGKDVIKIHVFLNNDGQRLCVMGYALQKGK